MARDPDTIQREIEDARRALEGTLDELAERANPKRLVEGVNESAQAKLSDPKVKYTLIGVVVLVVLVLLRRLFR